MALRSLVLLEADQERLYAFLIEPVPHSSWCVNNVHNH